MLKTTRFLLLASVMTAAGLAMSVPAQAKEFVYDAKTNQQIAKRLGIPVYFTVPDSARLPLPKSIDTPDRLIDFKHPDAIKANAEVGLRLVVTKRSGLAKRLAKSGLVQTGDLLLTFRAEWGGVGAYPNVQMGISHTGLAYLKDGVVHNIDNPLSEEYMGRGMRAELNSEHYNTLNLLHIIRPRNLTEAQRANLVAWATRLNKSAHKVYPSKLKFNQDYNDPKYKPRKPLDFVQHLGQIALGQNPPGTIDMFCSEFAWSLLALRGCDPATSAADFKGENVPACITPPMRPMRATGNYVTSKSRSSYVGLGDGPLVVIDALKLPAPERESLVKSIFVANPAGFKRMSVGHRELAQSMQPKFEKLETYYASAASGSWLGVKARLLSAAISRSIPENYSPTSFLINTLLAPDNANRSMDYVATILIE
ncbi:MAG TPA: hypothetical protein VFZ16_15155 [Hyphomicrobiaceae bacterium]|nr:hypothetical protein [Hyphomicrobiaceae bacterium]